MNFNVWNIKEMLSIPSGSGTTKPSNWSNNQTDYSTLSDSQFLFGSQFCPENSETLAAPLDFSVQLRHPKQLQQNSLDSEPSIFTKYQMKPQLFGGDTKDGGTFSLPLPVAKSKDLLKQFEEKNQRTKEKCDSETLYNFVSHVRESIHKLQTSVEKSEEHLSSRSQSILDSLETVAKTLQETARTQRDLMIEAMQEKGSMEQAILELQKRSETRQAEFIEMKSSLKHLEGLVSRQGKDLQQLCEQLGQLNVPRIQAELKRLSLVPQAPGHVKESTSQTSPSLAPSLSVSRQEQCAPEELLLWQAQAPAAMRKPGPGSLGPGECGVWSEGAESGTVQGQAVLPILRPRKGNRQTKDKQMQTESKGWANTGPQSHGSHIPGRRVCGDRDLASQGALQLISQDSDNFTNNIQNVCPEYQGKSMFSCGPHEQVLTEKKGKTAKRGRKGLPPKKAPRGRMRASEQKQTPSKTCTFRSEYQSSPSPVSDPQRSSTGQQQPLVQPVHLQSPKSPLKPTCLLGRTVKRSRTTRAVPGSLLQLTRGSSQDSETLSNSSPGDHQMRWFSDLSHENSEHPLCQEAGKTLLYNLGLDSSDDDF